MKQSGLFWVHYIFNGVTEFVSRLLFVFGRFEYKD